MAAQSSVGRIVDTAGAAKRTREERRRAERRVKTSDATRRGGGSEERRPLAVDAAVAAPAGLEQTARARVVLHLQAGDRRSNRYRNADCSLRTALLRTGERAGGRAHTFSGGHISALIRVLFDVRARN